MNLPRYAFCNQHIKATKSELSGDRIEELERELSQAKSAAQEADKRCEDVVRSASLQRLTQISQGYFRRLTLMEHTRDRAEEKASRAEDKVCLLYCPIQRTLL